MVKENNCVNGARKYLLYSIKPRFYRKGVNKPAALSFALRSWVSAKLESSWVFIALTLLSAVRTACSNSTSTRRVSARRLSCSLDFSSMALNTEVTKSSVMPTSDDMTSSGRDRKFERRDTSIAPPPGDGDRTSADAIME